MTDPVKNPDGTTQVSPPTMSAFAPSNQKPQPPAPTPAASNDHTSTPEPDHENNMIEGIKALFRQHSGGSANKAEDSALKALDAGASSAPGNTADY